MDKSKVAIFQSYLKSDYVKKSYTRLRAISGISRFRIIVLLRKEKNGLNVSEISKILKSSLSKISHQLFILRKEKIVVDIGKGRETIYKMNDHKLDDYLNCVI